MREREGGRDRRPRVNSNARLRSLALVLGKSGALARSALVVVADRARLAALLARGELGLAGIDLEIDTAVAVLARAAIAIGLAHATAFGPVDGTAFAFL